MRYTRDEIANVLHVHDEKVDNLYRVIDKYNKEALKIVAESANQRFGNKIVSLDSLGIDSKLFPLQFDLIGSDYLYNKEGVDHGPLSTSLSALKSKLATDAYSAYALWRNFNAINVPFPYMLCLHAQDGTYFDEDKWEYRYFLQVAYAPMDASGLTELSSCLSPLKAIDGEVLTGTTDVKRIVEGLDRLTELDDALDRLAARCPELEKVILESRVTQSHPYNASKEEAKRTKI